MKKHMEVHDESKSYPCPLCEKSFSEFGDLRKHDRTHSGVKPYSCNDCGQSFSQKSNLNTHKKMKSACLTWKKQGQSKNGKTMNFVRRNILRSERTQNINAEPSEWTLSPKKTKQMPILKEKDIKKCVEDYQMTDKYVTVNNKNISKYEQIRHNKPEEMFHSPH